MRLCKRENSTKQEPNAFAAVVESIILLALPSTKEGGYRLHSFTHPLTDTLYSCILTEFGYPLTLLLYRFNSQIF